MKLHINGAERDIDASPDMPLPWVIRDRDRLASTPPGCGTRIIDQAVHEFERRTIS